jgi:hypothetical protein
MPASPSEAVEKRTSRGIRGDFFDDDDGNDYSKAHIQIVKKDTVGAD